MWLECNLSEARFDRHDSHGIFISPSGEIAEHDVVVGAELVPVLAQGAIAELKPIPPFGGIGFELTGP